VYYSIYVVCTQTTKNMRRMVVHHQEWSYNKVTHHSNKTVNMIHINWCGRIIHSLTEAFMHLL